VDAEESWKPIRQKLKRPLELIVSSLRLLLPTSARLSNKQRSALYRQAQVMGQVPFAAPSPKGWSDQASDWLGGEALLRRLHWAERMGKKFGMEIDNPSEFAQRNFLLSKATRTAIEGAPDRSTAIALLLASPEFQRR